MQDSFHVHSMDFQSGDTPQEPEATSTPQPYQPSTQQPMNTQDPVRSLYQQRPGAVPVQNAQRSAKKSPLFPVLAILVILGGVATGYGINKLQAKDGSADLTGDSDGVVQQVASGKVSNGDVFGDQDASKFKDSAEGYLQIGGIDGEGSHRLLRDGGPTQTVYLTSASTDLDKFEGMQVKVSGETFKGQKAGWLMDVAQIKILEVQGTAPAGSETTQSDGGGL